MMTIDPEQVRQRSLTDRQQQAYDFICAYWTAFGCGPTIREICAEMSIGSPNGVKCHLDALERRGLILRNGYESRTIRPVRNVVACVCPHCGGGVEAVQEFNRD